MNYTVLILEDEKHQQELLSGLLSKFPEFQIKGIASRIEEAKALVMEHQPDLMFLDVMVPPHTSFDFLRQLPSIEFEIIFTTTFEMYAIQAFKLSAIDYLLKPVDEKEFAAAVEKFKQKRISQDSTVHVDTLLSNLQGSHPNNTKVALPTLNGFIFTEIKKIIRCESDNTYTTFYLMGEDPVIACKTLKECEHMLADYQFFRVHNSHLINLAYVSEYTKGEGGIVRMADGSHIDVSRRRRDEFLRQLKKV
jgi:two-component system, LytTR family, response regulator